MQSMSVDAENLKRPLANQLNIGQTVVLKSGKFVSKSWSISDSFDTFKTAKADKILYI